ncbi:MAG: insulinase family protein, partial [Gammaproteobacteria bacterium]|nr:insulinase family protein [Gammaproteobacteria bacterium]
MKTSDGAFRQIKGQHIGTLDLDVLTYEHIKTGAMHYHLQADHKENVFLVAFRTHPMDSTGVAHILEHTVLCGSQRYPVRDPFFMMIRRSLNTFMNAFTSSDYTAYPFASQNRNDYFNLLDVYLDAVFAPNLNELDFRQEGHRLEFETPDDPDSRLVYKGVVYNEMKGSNSSPDSLMYDLLKKHLFPETTYHYNSGGDPQVIPDLTYPEFLAFYKTHYHPSNAIFMTFGDIPVEEVQAIIEEKALCKFSVLDSKLTVAPETRLPKPISVIEPYSLDAGEDTDSQCHFVLSWLLGNSTNLMEQIQGHLLTDLLLDTSGSPLRHALESSGLGATISPLSGLEDSHREMSFICGLKGCRAEDADKIEALILETLETLARDGVPDERLDAVLYQLELHQREIGGDSYPYGLQLMFFCLSAAVHHADPIALLDLDSVIDTLHEEVKQPGYVQGLVKRLLLENTHRVRLLMVPDAQLSERLAQSERARLDTLLSKMTKADRQYLIEQTHLLKARQEAEDNVDLLPKVGIEDIPPDFTEPQPVESSLANRDRVSVYCAGTNGLVYQQLILPMPAVDAGFLSLLPLYTTALSEVGVAGRTYVETQLLQQAVSGGISAFSSFRPGLRNDDPLVAYLTVATRALGSSFEKASKLLMETILSPRFDETRHLLDLVKRMRVRREASLVRNGHLLAMHAASRNLSTVAALHHRLTGLASLNWIRQLEKQLDGPERTGELGNDLHALHQMMIQGPRQHLLISDEAHYHEALQI